MCSNTKKTTDETRKWKVEGEAFDRLKSKRDALDKATEEAQRIHSEAHKAFWDAVHDELPETDREKNYTLDRSYASLGFYVVKENEDAGGIKGLIGALALKAALKD